MNTETDQKICVLTYGRVSTPDADQIQSLFNQEVILKKYSKSHNIIEVRSVSKGMTKKCKEVILKLKEDNPNSKLFLVVTAIDRLTRNVNDIEFLRNNIAYIQVHRENNRVYDVKKEWNLIANQVANAEMELEKIRERCKQGKSLELGENSESMDAEHGSEDMNISKRKSENDLSRIERLLTSSKKRCMTIDNVLKKIGINNNDISQLDTLICDSQGILGESEWKKISKLSRKMGGSNIIEDYKPDNETLYHIPRRDIHNYVMDIINKRYTGKIDEIYIKQLVNSRLNMIKYKKIREKLTDEPFDLDSISLEETNGEITFKVSDLTEIFKNFGIEESETKISDAIKKFMGK